MAFNSLQVALAFLYFSWRGAAEILPQPRPRAFDTVPRRDIAGVLVVDTPLVREAQQFTRDHSNDHLYGHIMRSWLFTTLMIQHNSTLSATVDPEVLAVAAIMHDLGFDQTEGSPVVSPDRRFEVDGAIAAREFIRGHPDGSNWEERRVQLVWDAIALHGDGRIALFKELEVSSVYSGIEMELIGPAYGVTQEEYDRVMEEFPRVGFQESMLKTVQWLCGKKPFSTYENFVQGWGEEVVPGYAETVKGNRTVDRVLGRPGSRWDVV
jgi:hypothetical protein